VSDALPLHDDDNVMYTGAEKQSRRLWGCWWWFKQVCVSIDCDSNADARWLAEQRFSVVDLLGGDLALRQQGCAVVGSSSLKDI
jgi:hypothetical protein